MGMRGNFIRIGEKTIQEIQQGVLSVWDLLYDENKKIDTDNVLNIDKAWHAIHFILTGRQWGSTDDEPLSKIIGSESPVNDKDMGYGPAMLITDKEIHDINNALKIISQDWFRAKFSISDMQKNEIYPIMNDEDEDEFFDYVYSYFKEVIIFFEKAENANQYILFFIS